MGKHLALGTTMTVIGLVLYFVFHDVETPVVGPRQAGLVIAVLGALELTVAGYTLLWPEHR